MGSRFMRFAEVVRSSDHFLSATRNREKEWSCFHRWVKILFFFGVIRQLCISLSLERESVDRCCLPGGDLISINQENSSQKNCLASIPGNP